MSQNALDQRVFTTAQAAQFCGLSPRTLEKYRVSGDGPVYIKLGRSVRYQLADLQNWIDGNRLQNTAQNHD